MELSEHLFRHESGRMVAALTRFLGVERLALAEDVVQDAFVSALEVWKVRGVPDNPAAWLMAAAKHRALDVLRRERTARESAPAVGRMHEAESTPDTVLDAFADEAVHEEQLQMMFSCCHPRISDDAQVALMLDILCGFGSAEIAAAFLTGQAAVEKRISRGKKILAESKHLFDLDDERFAARLSAVRRALYLLFNEGYHGASAESAIRAELCEEAIRLTMLLLDDERAGDPETRALAALMCLHAARLPARTDAAGDLNPWMAQDRARWNSSLVARGLSLLERSAAGGTVSAFHIEAAIAAAHTSAPSPAETNWSLIVDLYDRLMSTAPSPVVALNRAVAIGERDGPARGLDALRAISDRERLQRYPFYPAALGELELRLGNVEAARGHYSAALSVARNDAERRFLSARLEASA